MRRIGLLFACFAALLLSFTSLRPKNTFFTLSDAFFIASGFSIIAFYIKKSSYKVGTRNRKKFTLWFLWLIGSILITIGLLMAELFQRYRNSNLVNCILQYNFVFIYLPFLIREFSYEENVKIGKYLLMGFAISVLLGTSLWAFFKNFYQNIVEKGYLYGTQRVGFFIGINGTPKFVALCIPLVYYYYLKNFIGKISLFIFVLTFILGTLLPASWGGTLLVISSFVMLMLLTLLMKPGKLLKSLLELVLIIILCIGLLEMFMPGLWIETFENRIYQKIKIGEAEQYGSYQIRKKLADEALHFIYDSPIIGLGAGNYKRYSKYNLQPHNSVLLVLSEGGIISGIGLIIIVLSAIIFAVKNLYSNERKKEAVSATVIVTVLVLSFFVSNEPYVRFVVFPVILMLNLLEKDEKSNES